MLRIQPESIKAKDENCYIVRFKRIASEHPECGVGEYELPEGFVEYPYEFETVNGFRGGKGWPKQFYWDTHDDGSGALWVRYAVAMLDSAGIEGIRSLSGQIYKPFEVILNELTENLDQEYLVTFDCNGSKVQCPFIVTGDDQQLSISWKEGSHKAFHGQRWTLEDEADSSAEGKLVRCIAMLHAARNFIYGPDKPWEPKDS